MNTANNIKAFVGAAVVVIVASVGLVQAGVIDDQGTGADVVGNPTNTPAALGQTQTPVVGSSTPSAPPTDALTPTVTAEPTLPAITEAIELPIMMYHQVLPELPADEFDAALTVTTADLNDQISYLKCAGYTPITMSALLAAFEGRAALPENPIILTFDDGWSDHYTYLFPILQEQGVVASLAIITGAIDEPAPYMTWAQVEEMAGAGHEMMSHSVTHPDMNGISDEQLLNEIAGSKAELEQHIGRPVELFVYPSGEPFRNGSQEKIDQVVQMVVDAGYKGAVLAGPNGMTQDPAAPFALNRIRVYGGEDIYTYAATIAGPAPDSVSC
jgi:peptidoglycan/xylan/chitin deacetylase (PgdA/CDA1 family)